MGNRKNDRQVQPAHDRRTRVSPLRGTLRWGCVWVLMDHDEFNLPDSIPSHSDCVERKAKCRDALVYCSKIRFSLQAVGPQSPSAAPDTSTRPPLLVGGVDQSLGDTPARRALFTAVRMLSTTRCCRTPKRPAPAHCGDPSTGLVQWTP